MRLCLLFVHVILIPSFYGANISVSLDQSSTTPKTTSLPVRKSETKLTMLTEGGKVVTDVPVSILSKEKSTILLALDKELGTTDGKKPVKPRKGALLDSAELDKLSKIMSSNATPINETEKFVTKLIPVDKQHTKTNSSTAEPKIMNSIKTHHVNTIVSTPSQINKTTVVTEHVKKPRILVYDDLARDKMNESPLLPDLKSSSKPESDQIPSPHSKLHLKAKGAEPGMIMPIVITIVVVPAFAVLAYMAVKRGKEAWRNRHYKRMDFLLDGMYND